MIKNNSYNYGWVAKALHWSVAFIIIGIFTIGYVMTYIPKSSFRLSLYDFHKATGLVLFSLILIRLVWRFSNEQPALPENISKIQKYIAHANILMLYLLMFLMPITGFLRSSLGGYPITFYSLFTLSPLSHNHGISELFSQIHLWLGYLLAGAFTLHVIGALHHQLILKDALMKRMWFYSNDSRSTHAN